MKLANLQDLNTAVFREGDTVELPEHKFVIKHVQIGYPYGRMRVLFSTSILHEKTGQTRDVVYVDDEMFKAFYAILTKEGHNA